MRVKSVVLATTRNIRHMPRGTEDRRTVPCQAASTVEGIPATLDVAYVYGNLYTWFGPALGTQYGPYALEEGAVTEGHRIALLHSAVPMQRLDPSFALREHHAVARIFLRASSS